MDTSPWSTDQLVVNNHIEAERLGGWPSDPRPLWMRLLDAVGTAVVAGAIVVAVLYVAISVLAR